MAKKKNSPKKKSKIVMKVNNKSTPSKSFVWAVNPFEENIERLKNTKALIEDLINKDFKIQPVYVLSPDNFNIIGDFSDHWIKKFQPIVKENFKKLINNLNLSNTSLLDLEILVNKQKSMIKDIQKISSFVKKNKSISVILSSHSRRGLGRLIMGSFAETAILYKGFSTIVISENTQVTGKINKVLFATDFSKGNFQLFKKCLSFCNKTNSDIYLFHRILNPIEPVVQAGVYMAGGGWVTLDHYFEKQRDIVKVESKKWFKEADKCGVKLNLQFDEGLNFIEESVNDYCLKESIDMVFVGSQSTKTNAILIGSTARTLVRDCVRPVWVEHL